MERGAAGAVALALAALLVAAAAPAGAQDAEAEPRRGSFLKRLWSDLTGRGERRDGPAAAAPQAQAAAGPAAEAPSLAQAQWVGFTPAVVAGSAAGDGSWIAGPFAEAGGDGWVTDTVSGLTVAVRLVWRDAAPGSLAELSAEAGHGLGLTPGAVANVAVYLAR